MQPTKWSFWEQLFLPVFNWVFLVAAHSELCQLYWMLVAWIARFYPFFHLTHPMRLFRETIVLSKLVELRLHAEI
jgi:hypothetical protein